MTVNTVRVAHLPIPGDAIRKIPVSKVGNLEFISVALVQVGAREGNQRGVRFDDKTTATTTTYN